MAPSAVSARDPRSSLRTSSKGIPRAWDSMYRCANASECAAWALLLREWPLLVSRDLSGKILATNLPSDCSHEWNSSEWDRVAHVLLELCDRSRGATAHCQSPELGPGLQH